MVMPPMTPGTLISPVISPSLTATSMVASYERIEPSCELAICALPSPVILYEPFSASTESLVNSYVPHDGVDCDVYDITKVGFGAITRVSSADG